MTGAAIAVLVAAFAATPGSRSATTQPASAPAADWVGYGGPGGSRVFPATSPPLTFGGPAGENVAWVVPLPGWGHGSPIVVGERVLLMCEPGVPNDFPLLVCLDAATGELRWQKELDHLDALVPDAARRAEVRAQWQAVQAFSRLKYAYRRATATGPSEEVDRKYRALGLDPETSGDKLSPLDAAAHTRRKKELEKVGLTFETWHDHLARGVDCVGQAYGTPVSDGQRVYVGTAFGAFWCFDLDGRQQWLTCDPFVGEAYIYGYDYCKNGRSPILYGDLVIHTVNNRVRALDRATGRVVWSDNGPHEARAHTIVTPAVLRTGGRDVLLTAGPCAYLLPEGRRLTIDGWKDEGMQYLVKSDEPDVVFLCGSGEHCGWTEKGKGDLQPPAAVRFTLEGTTLRARVLWQGADLARQVTAASAGNEVLGGNAPWLLYHAGRLYHRAGVILDAATGRIIAGRIERRGTGRAVPETRHLLCVAAGHVYGLGRAGPRDGGGAVMEVFTLDGRKVAANLLASPVLTPQQKDLAAHIGWGDDGQAEWGKGYTFTFGPKRLYVRSMMNLYCIAAPPGPASQSR